MLQFFNTISYTIGGYTFALNEIENGVLRSNRKAIGAVTKPFSKSDPRLKVALPAPEPKIHFALVCGAKSCPPIKTYTSAVRFCVTFSKFILWAGFHQVLSSSEMNFSLAAEQVFFFKLKCSNLSRFQINRSHWRTHQKLHVSL